MGDKGGRKDKEKPKVTADIIKQLETLKASGATAKEAMAKVALETGLSRKEIYQAWLRL